MIRIRFKTFRCSWETLESRLNAYGHDQWDLDQFQPVQRSDGSEGHDVLAIIRQMYDDGEPDPAEETAKRESGMKMRG